MVSASSKMADTRSTLLECSVKFRQGRKWKTRWCVMSRQSPVSAEVILKFYKDQNALLNNKELGREQVCVSAANYSGLEYCYRYPKNIHVLTIVLSKAVILLSFENHERLLEWYHKIKNTLPSAVEFKIRVSIPSKGKLPSGRASFYFYNNHFAITPETPTRLICAWNLKHVIRYGSFEGGFAFSVKVLNSPKSSNYLLLVDDPECIKNHFDAATLKHLPSRWSTHSEPNPANRDDEQGTLAAERQRLLNANAKDIRYASEQRGEHERTMERILERTMESKENEEPHEGDALMSGADLNRNMQCHSDSRMSREVIELTDMGIRESQSWTSVDRTDGSSQSRTDGNSRSNLSGEETAFEHEMLLCPQKNTPIREQEYEVMASFDHYRSSIHEDVDSGRPCQHRSHLEGNKETHATSHSGSHRGGGGGGGMGASQHCIQYLINTDRFKLNLAATPDEREYVNLPSPKTTLSNTLPACRRKRSTPVLLTLPKPDILESFNFSPPSSPPPPPPVHKRTNSSFSSLKETSIHVGLYPSLEFTGDSFGSLPQDILVPIPFDHATLVKPVGPIARLKRSSQDSETSSYIASGSDYDSSHYSSAASSRHNSFDRDPFLLKPPPVPPKSANLRLPSIETLLSNHPENFSSEILKIAGLSRTSSPLQDNLPPIPPKPDHLRGRPLPRGPPSPISPTGCPPFLPPRKRCNTVPSFTTEEGDTEWVELPDEKDEGYLIMKPAYDNKLKSMHTRSKSVPDEETAHSQTLPLTQRSWQTPSPRMQSPGTPTFSEPCSPIMEFIPQSPIHNAGDMRIQTLKRSATIGGFGRKAVRSPSFLAGRRPSLLRGSRQRRSLSSDPGNSHRTSDISLNSAPMPRRRRSDKYGSLDIRSMSLLNTRLEDFKDECEEVPPSPSNTTAFYPDDFQHLKDELDKFAGPLSLSPPSSVNSPSRSPPLTPASSEESIHDEPDQMHSLP